VDGFVEVHQNRRVWPITANQAFPQLRPPPPMLQRNLVYTGVTRGKRLVVLVGQRKALVIAVKCWVLSGITTAGYSEPWLL
jgi:hypothetical protein